MPVRVGKPQGTVLWSDGTPFNGYFLAGIVLPKSGGVVWPFVTLEGAAEQRIPIWFPIPIKNGNFNPSGGLIFNEDINPPNSQYVAYYYDKARQKIAGPSSFFTVSSETFTPPVLTLSATQPGDTGPTPDG